MKIIGVNGSPRKDGNSDVLFAQIRPGLGRLSRDAINGPGLLSHPPRLKVCARLLGQRPWRSP